MTTLRALRRPTYSGSTILQSPKLGVTRSTVIGTAVINTHTVGKQSVCLRSRAAQGRTLMVYAAAIEDSEEEADEHCDVFDT